MHLEIEIRVRYTLIPPIPFPPPEERPLVHVPVPSCQRWFFMPEWQSSPQHRLRRVNDDLTKPGQRPLGEVVRNPADPVAKPKRAAFGDGRLPQSPRPRVAGDGSREGASVFPKILGRVHSGGPEKSLSSPSQPTAGQPEGRVATFGSTYLWSH